MKSPPKSHKNFLLLVFFLLLLIPSVTQAQTDTRFWFAAPDVSVGHGDNPIRIVVSAFDIPATVTVTQPANLAFPTYIVNVAANSSEVIDIQPSIALVETPYDAPGLPISVSTTGLLVESTAKITAYYEVNNYTNNDIFALKGKNGLGLEFFVPFQNSWNHQQGLAPNGRSGFIVVATEDNTTLIIRPTVALEGGQAANANFNVTLNKGETYVGSVNQPLAGGFPSGTRIRADKPVAVTKFSDSMNSGEGGCYDLAGDQLVPINILGREYVVLRGRLGVGSGTPAGNPELVVVTSTQTGNTQVRVNGVLVTTLVGRGATYTHTLPTAGEQIFIQTTKDVYVGHYAGYGCETGFALLPPVSCTGSLTTRIVRSAADVGDDFTINLMTRGTLVGGSPLPNSYNFTNNFTIKVTIAGVTTTLFSPSGTPFPAVFTQVGSSIYYGAQHTFSAADVPADAVVTVESTSVSVNDPAGLFHLGFVNGGAGSGTRYGYFSDFRSLDLGSDLNINYGTNTTVTADIAATNFEWFSDGVSVQNGASNSYTVTDIQRRQTIRVEAKVGDCILSDEICVGTLEYVWDGSIITPGDLFPDIDNSDNWSKPCGLSGIPSCNIDIIIPPTPVAFSILTVPSGKVLNVRNISILSNATGTINGNLNVLTGGLVNVCGDMVHNGTLSMQTGSDFKFVGTGRQDYSKGTTGLGDFENLYIANTITTSTFNNVPGVTILSSSVQDLSVSTTGSLNFVQGYIVPEGFVNASLAADPSRTVVIKNPDPNAITGFAGAGATTLPTNYFIAGKLNRAKNATGTYPFPVGLVLQEPSKIEAEPTKDGTMLNFEPDDWQTATYPTGATCTPSGILRMNGSSNNEYVDFQPNTGNIGIGGGAARTVEIWANITTFDGAGLFQFGNDDFDGNPATSQSADFALVTGTTDNDWTIRIDNGFILELINLPNSKNEWNHYALTYNGNPLTPQLAFYYNGLLIRNYDLKDASNNPAPLNTVLTNGFVGKWSGSGTSLKGRVDELKIWSEQRTTAQIKESFNQGCASNALQCPQANNLKAYYDFQDGIINGNGFRKIQSRTITCPVPTFTYQRADVEFNSASTVNNVTGSFKEYNTVPNPTTGQTNICGANFDTEPALDNGFWNFSSFNGAIATPINATYEMYLFNRDFGNDGSGSTTVMKLEPTDNPYGLTPPWIIPTGLCEANTAIFTGRSGFAGNMGFFATAQSLDITLLPIQLLSLTAKPKENAILVEWTTLQEKDNYGFDVFRAEENGEFVKIGFVESKKQNQSEQNYNFLDVEVDPNVNYYYKLKQIDYDGKFNFTKTVTAKLSDGDFTGEQINTIYPNPTDDEFTLYLGGKEFKKATQVQITLVNAIGEELESRTIHTQSGNRISFRLTRYPKGMYLLRIVSETSSTILKVVKE